MTDIIKHKILKYTITENELQYILEKWNNMKPHYKGNWSKSKDRIVK